MDKKPGLNKIALGTTLLLAVLMLVGLFATRQTEKPRESELPVVAAEDLNSEPLIVGEKTPDDPDLVETDLIAAGVTESNQQTNEVRLQLPALQDQDYDWIAARIFENEAASQVRYLTFWGEGEDFPSFGIGHFIWFPANVDAPFDEQFPDMVAYVSQRSAGVLPLPAWMREWVPFDAPWSSKEVFDQAWSTEKMTELREWLQATARWQARFIVSTFEKRWQALELPSEQKLKLTALLQQLAGSAAGLFAIIDYYNFKGLGVNPRERYQGQGWGLVQVLQAMPAYSLPGQQPESGALRVDDAALVAQFSQAAADRLSLRVELAPEDRNEARWLPGWLKRLQGYLPIDKEVTE